MKLINLNEIFDVSYGGNFSRVMDYEPGTTPVIKSQASNNGVISFLDIEPNYSGVLTVARTGSVGASFYHGYPCYVTNDCMVVRPKRDMAEVHMLIYSKYIQQNSYKYNYSRKVTPARLMKEMIPDFKDIIRISNQLILPARPKSNPVKEFGVKINIDSRPSGKFQLGDLFDIKKGQRLTKAKMEIGKTPFIGAIDSNNGYRQYVNADPNHPGNTITVNYNGSVAEAFYQSKPYWASDDVNILYPKFLLTPFIAMFFCTLIRQEKFRYNYGRKWHLGRMKESLIKLPIKEGGEPDFELIESYIQSLSYSANM